MNFLWASAIGFFVLWVLGVAAFHIASWSVHILLVLAVLVVVVRLVTGRGTAA